MLSSGPGQFPQLNTGLDCGLELEIKVFELSLNSEIQVLERHEHPGHVRKIVVIPFEDLLSFFKVLKKCRNKFDCLIAKRSVSDMHKTTLENSETDSIRAKVFVQLNIIYVHLLV